ncbi:ATP-dependent RNA helicase DbpA [Thiomicrorhabdus sediminis]|uniref:ATP-dependent RNA helicase DbpA n=1 Tax=Thiomicrorhabdus sediminis TaxID=2580412 RepID=A0A4P9K5Q7_9GAMM|nr:ATP-dependent RNA helicase DbpA [Thiomicrorhabdus sediminis]QCU90335.1 ATP-dependent RNA helicase DbpA [Thiomicrorhabdus sediminis]
MTDITESSFLHLDLPPAQLKNLQQLGYHHMTPIQEQALPIALGGHDLIAQAKTGSGKTAAFGLALLNRLQVSELSVQALVVCPTRELSNQVAEELRRLARFQANIKIVVVSGGVPMRPQVASLENGAHIVVGTPGRLNDHIDKGNLSLANINTLVLDEADRMLEMGFKEQMLELLKDAPHQRQTMLFSATFPDDIEYISRRFQKNPMQVTVEAHHDIETIEQLFYMCHHKDKLPSLQRILSVNQFDHAMIFCNTKALVAEVVEFLNQRGFDAVPLHGDMQQREREQVLMRFKHHSTNFLVATDVAARGLDISALPAVINYELPRHQETYTHRIGRTGRAGLAGKAITLFTEKERYKLDHLSDYQGYALEYESIERLDKQRAACPMPPYITLYISGGRKEKVRRGDILGAITKQAGISGEHVGKIDVVDHSSYVAIERGYEAQVISELNQNKIKGRKFKVGRVQ